MRAQNRVRALVAATAAISVAAALASGTAQAAPPSQPPPDPGASVPAGQRAAALGADWSTSGDRAWTTSGDAEGFHLLVADKKSGYAWRTAASLSEPGFDADMWIGNACVTGSGKRAVVAYAPRTFTNDPELMARGAFAAVVDLGTGKVAKLKRQVSLAYFSPGCGLGETAVLTQLGGEHRNATRLITVNAATARLGKPIRLKGQVTSAIPVGEAIVAADGARLVKIGKTGRRTAIARTGQIPFLLKADAQGGVTYLDRTAAATRAAAPDAHGEVRRVSGGQIGRPDAAKTRPALLATGALTNLDLTSSANGTVFVTGRPRPAGDLPDSVRVRTDIPRDAVATTRGEALVTQTAWADGEDPRALAGQSAGRRTAEIGLRTLSTGKDLEFHVIPGTRGVARTVQGHRASPALPAPAAKTGGERALRSGTVDGDRTCAVPRNDPAKQAMQPKPRQVEWAVNMAVSGNLNYHISRPANWKNLGMPAYRPQDPDMFPLRPLAGGGRIPMQVMLGITAQESNMWQASRVAVPGVTGNPLIGNYYGVQYSPDGEQQDPWAIDWADADCGYGITQVTDGMRLPGKEKDGEVAKTAKQQEAIALDYTANIAAGVNILIEKWNQTYNAGLKIDDGDPRWLENWYFALWAYNSGFYPESDSSENAGTWGLGFTNNPANPLWKANRVPFLSSWDGAGDDYSHAAHPQDWPYQEKVLGWAARPLQALESPNHMVVGFRPAWWTNNGARMTVKAPESTFCTSANNCDPAKIADGDSNQPGMGACTRTDLHCWWHWPTSWKKCDNNVCGNEIWRFDPPADYPEQADGTAYPPNCTTNGLPAGALIVDDVPDNTPIHRPGCSVPKASSGKFSFDFGTESAKIDLHQLGAGYSGHFWFAHSRNASSQYDRLRVTGTWKLNEPISEPQARILVHIPDHGAQVKSATYTVDTALGPQEVKISQADNQGNTWVDLGVFGFTGVTPQVRLSNYDANGTGDLDVAFDAVAFVPGTWKPAFPVLTLPNGVPNSPDPEDDPATDVPEIAPSGYTQRSLRREAGAVCTPVEGRPGEELCREPIKEEPRVTTYELPKRTPPDRRPAKATADEPETIACGVGNIAYTRTGACGVDRMRFIRKVDGREIGALNFTFRKIIRLRVASNTFEEIFDAWPDEGQAWPTSMATFGLNTTFKCGGACRVDNVDWSGSPLWTAGDQGRVVSALVDYSWTGSATANSLDNLSLSSESDWDIPPLPGYPKGQKDDIPTWTVPELNIRCDNRVAGSSGCVFDKYIPTYTVDTKEYPVAGALYWTAMQRLSSHPGSKGHSSPLHRGFADVNAGTNRAWMCGAQSGDPGGYRPHPDSFLGGIDPEEQPECDEYAFAAAQESAGSNKVPVTGAPRARTRGIACAQFYATKKSGKWQLLADTRGSLPTWNEPCVRGAIPGDQNGAAGGGVGGIVSKYRLQFSDPYYIETPGFENCSINAASCEIKID